MAYSAASRIWDSDGSLPAEAPQAATVTANARDIIARNPGLMLNLRGSAEPPSSPIFLYVLPRAACLTCVAAVLHSWLTKVRLLI